MLWSFGQVFFPYVYPVVSEQFFEKLFLYPIDFILELCQKSVNHMCQDQYLYSLIFSYTNLYTYIFANITVSWLYIFRGSLLFCLILSSPKCFTSIWLHFFLLELKSMALGLIKWTNLSLTFKANRIIRWLTFFFTVYAHFM